MSQGAPPSVEGFVAPGFEPMIAAFEANFRPREGVSEIGAALGVFRRGELVVDLWGGARTPGGPAWTQDTLVNVFSTTKGLVATALAVLADQGSLDYDAPVSRYWPEFAQAGKQAVTVAQLLSHQAGLVGFDEPTTIEDLYDWPLVCDRLARQAPRWAPGEKNGYHAITFGYLAGELVRRITGRSVGAFIRDELAGRMGADVHVALSADDDHRVAPVINPPQTFQIDPASLPAEAIAMATNPAVPATTANTAAWRRAEIPAAGGHCSARGVATLYAALANGGSLDGRTLLRPRAVERLRAEQTGRPDVCLGVAPGWGLGMMLNRPGWFGPGAGAFGHAGLGGSFGCADPETGLAIGYVMNQLGGSFTEDTRRVDLIAGLYACIT